MFFESFRSTGLAVVQIFLLGAVGYFLVKKGILGGSGLDMVSRLVVEVTLPVLIFCQLLKDFRFNLYPEWWIFPLLSIVITIAGLVLGFPFTKFVKGPRHKTQFLSLVTFQNSGYLPLALISALLPKDKADPMLTYLFLFLLGFNLVVWSFGVYMLSFHENKKFEMGALFSPPVIAVTVSLVIIFLGLHRIIPHTVLKPMRMIGDCTVPLAMFVVGGSLATMKARQFDIKPLILMVIVKLLILPACGLWLVLQCKLPALLGLLIVMQLAVPPATSLSVIVRHYKKEDLLISQGVLVGHIVSLVTLPLFLSIYFSRVMIQ